jgi:hypothetical protein
MAEFALVADGLRFPEGPVVMPDGSVILVEIAQGQITRVRPDGSKSVIAKPGGATMVGSNISKPMAFLRRTASRRIIQAAGLSASISKPARSKYCINRATSGAACVGRTTSCSTQLAGSGSPIMARLIMQNVVMMSSAFSMPRPMAAIWKKSSSRQTTPMALACPPMAARSTPPKPTPVA